MSIEAPHTTGLFAELLEGANALAQRPTLIAERDEAKATAQAERDRSDRFALELDKAKAAITDLKASLEAKEAALAQATFQHEALGSKLSLVADVLKDVMGNATAAMELVEPPKPEPVSVPMDPTHSETQSLGESGTSTVTETSTGNTTDLPGTFTHTEGFAVDREPMPIPMPMASPEGQSDRYPPHVSSSLGYPSPSAGGVSADRETSATGTGNEGQSAASPTASSESAPSPVAQPISETSTASAMEPSSPAAKPTAASLPKPYWEKPTGEDWLVWAKAGNDVAPWVTFNWYEKQELDALKRA